MYAMVAPIWPLGFVMLVQGVMIAHVEYICGSDVSLPEGLSITTDLVLELPSLLRCYCTYAVLLLESPFQTAHMDAHGSNCIAEVLAPPAS